jgi:hypothetical protein
MTHSWCTTKFPIKYYQEYYPLYSILGIISHKPYKFTIMHLWEILGQGHSSLTNKSVNVRMKNVNKVLI